MTDIERPYYQNSLGTSYKDYIIAILLKIFFFKKQTLFIQDSFRFTDKLRRKYRDFPYILCPHPCLTCPIVNISHQNGTFATIDASTVI